MKNGFSQFQTKLIQRVDFYIKDGQDFNKSVQMSATDNLVEYQYVKDTYLSHKSMVIMTK